MENRVMCLVMGYLVLGFLVAQSSAVDNPGCYGNCVDKCRKTKGLFGVAACGVICIAECAFDSPSLHSVPKNSHYFCKIGCASSLCASLLDQENPDIEKVGGCVDSCSDRCASNTFLPPNKN
ncbi:hypothetical protein L3X38_016414 [Prunus dulcis]|uniref:Thionin-like protein 2 n=1 Tax=Prunus dulcis TaxID=3755 RepID=A0AAD4W5A3_PRUDU|nr:hypothetical protein L3X38_016414 [Prunus dulcis]